MKLDGGYTPFTTREEDGSGMFGTGDSGGRESASERGVKRIGETGASLLRSLQAVGASVIYSGAALSEAGFCGGLSLVSRSRSASGFEKTRQV